jgi:transposase
MQERQIGIFDFQKHYNKHFEFKDALVSLNELIKWETFLPIIKEGIPRKEGVGRKPYDQILMIKIIILQAQYNLSDDQTEYQIYDRYSFRRFLGIEVGEKIPDAKTIWLFRDDLANGGIVEKLFEHFEEQLSKVGYKAQKGQVIDASIIPVPKQRNSREENAEIKKM